KTEAVQLAERVRVDELPPPSLSRLAIFLREEGELTRAVELLSQGVQLHPDDFKINYELGDCLARFQPPRWDEALRYYTAARAIRPNSPGAGHSVGAALVELKRWEEAIVTLREAIRLKPDSTPAYSNLGIALEGKGDLTGAITAHREAVSLGPAYAAA